MNLTFECLECKEANRAQIARTDSAVRCRHCSHATALRADAFEQERLDRCALCGTQELYIQKDFPHRLGLSIVAIGIVLSSLAWWQLQYPLALAVLLATAGLDLCLYYLVGDVLICYRCLAQYRGLVIDESHKPFDLAIGERYRQERLRLDLLRRTSKSAAEQSTSKTTAP